MTSKLKSAHPEAIANLAENIDDLNQLPDQYRALFFSLGIITRSEQGAFVLGENTSKQEVLELAEDARRKIKAFNRK